MMASQANGLVKSGCSMAWWSLAQLPVRRSDAIGRRRADDQADRRHRKAARDRGPRLDHRRQEWTHDAEEVEVDLTLRGRVAVATVERNRRHSKARRACQHTGLRYGFVCNREAAASHL